MGELGNPAPAVDLAAVRQSVDRAVRIAVAPGGMVARRSRPDSQYSWSEPSARAGFDAAQAVIAAAEQARSKYAVALRGEGVSWAEIADLLQVGWSEEYARVERAYELVAAPQGKLAGQRVYWHCLGPLGCGAHVTDYGPYDGHPSDCERGHSAACRRLAAETEAYEQEQVDRERRAEVMDAAMSRVADGFGQETVRRARYVQAHGGRYRAWSTGETLAVALVLRDDEQLAASGYSTRPEALRRVLGGMSSPPADPDEWLATLRAAATGLSDG